VKSLFYILVEIFLIVPGAVNYLTVCLVQKLRRWDIFWPTFPLKEKAREHVCDIKKNYRKLQVCSYWRNTIPKIWNNYSHKRKCSATVPISTFMCLWAIYILPGLVCLFCCRKICGPILEKYINLSHTHDCGNWVWGRAIHKKGIHTWDFRCSV
jgi:hypothetical protein